MRSEVKDDLFSWPSADNWQGRQIASLRSDNIILKGDGGSGSAVLLDAHIVCCPSYGPGLCCMHLYSAPKFNKKNMLLLKQNW
jgi:hypothetical protein